MYSALQPVLQHLWTLWELLVLGRRLAVIGASPGAKPAGIGRVQMGLGKRGVALQSWLDRVNAGAFPFHSFLGICITSE